MHNVCFKNYVDYTRWSFTKYDTRLRTGTCTSMNVEQVISKEQIFSIMLYYVTLCYVIRIYHGIFIFLVCISKPMLEIMVIR